MPYPKRIIKKAENYFADLRMNNETVKSTRTEEVYSKIPEIKELDAKILSLGSDFARNAFKGGKESFEEFKEKMMDINEKKAELLVEGGFDITYLDNIYNCRKCLDTGSVNGKYCECFVNKVREIAYSESNLPLIMDKKSFDDFRLDIYEDDDSPFSPRKCMETIRDCCEEYAADFPSSYENILMIGETGLGKTFLSSCIAKEVLNKGFSVYYQPAYRIFSVFEDHRFGTESQKELLKLQIEDIYNYDLLIIDDLGTEMVTAYTAEVLFDLINTRINKNKNMIINTNLTLENLETIYSPRITSRLIGNFTQYHFKGEDIRRKDI